MRSRARNSLLLLLPRCYPDARIRPTVLFRGCGDGVDVRVAARRGDATAYRAPVTGPHVIPFLPAFIPVEVCDTVGLTPAQPDGVAKCMAAVQADVADDGVSAPAADIPALRQVVSDARQAGIDLKVVVVPKNPFIDTPLRDIASEVGQANPGSTVLAISPSFAGTYSQSIDRATLEAGQDVAKTGNAVQSARNFVDQITTPIFPWTTLTIVLTLGVAAAAVTTRILQVRGKRAAAAAAPTKPATEPTEPSNISS
jgi:hypothetical protein